MTTQDRAAKVLREINEQLTNIAEATAGPWHPAIDTECCLAVFADKAHCQLPYQAGVNASEICMVAPPTAITEKDQANARLIAVSRTGWPTSLLCLKTAIEGLLQISTCWIGYKSAENRLAEHDLETLCDQWEAQSKELYEQIP